MPHLHDEKVKFLEDKKGQEFQDEIFGKMSADQRVAFGSRLWRLAKTLDSEKIDYGRNRPASSSQESSRNS